MIKSKRPIIKPGINKVYSIDNLLLDNKKRPYLSTVKLRDRANKATQILNF